MSNILGEAQQDGYVKGESPIKSIQVEIKKPNGSTELKILTNVDPELRIYPSEDMEAWARAQIKGLNAQDSIYIAGFQFSAATKLYDDAEAKIEIGNIGTEPKATKEEDEICKYIGPPLIIKNLGQLKGKERIKGEEDCGVRICVARALCSIPGSLPNQGYYLYCPATAGGTSCPTVTECAYEEELAADPIKRASGFEQATEEYYDRAGGSSR